MYHTSVWQPYSFRDKEQVPTTFDHSGSPTWSRRTHAAQPATAADSRTLHGWEHLRSDETPRPSEYITSWARFHHYRRRIDTIFSSMQMYEYHTGSHRSHIFSVVPSSSECRAGPRAVTTSSALSPFELRSWLPSASFPSASGPVKTIPYTLPRSVVLCRSGQSFVQET